MGLFGDIFKTITAPGRFLAKSPLGGMAKMAAPMVMGPAGIGVSAGIGALQKSDEDLGEMLEGGVMGGATGAGSYGMGKGVGALIGKYGGGAAVDPAMAGVAPSGHPGTDPLGVAGSPMIPAPAPAPVPAPAATVPPVGGAPPPVEAGGGGPLDKAFDWMGMGEMPPWMKWSMLLDSASSLGQLGYGAYDNERARKRGDNYSEVLSHGRHRRPLRGGGYGN